MRKIDWYIFLKLMQSTLFFTMVLMAVYWINRALYIFDELAAYGQKSIVYFELSILTLPPVIDSILPLGCFAAAVTVTNRISNDRELTILQVNGFSSWRIARPFVVLGLCVTCISLALSNFISPISKQNFERRSFEIRQNVTSKILKSGEFVHPAQDVTFFIERTRDDGTLEAVFLADQSQRQQVVLYSAAEAYFLASEGRSQMIMTNGTVQVIKDNSEVMSVTDFDELSYDLTKSIDQAAHFNLKLVLLTSLYLRSKPQEVIDLLRINPVLLVEEIHSRIAQPLLCLSATLIGFASLIIGRFSRFGNWRQISLAFLLLVLTKSIEGYVTPLIRKQEIAWYFAYSPWAFSAFAAIALLTLSTLPRGPKRAQNAD